MLNLCYYFLQNALKIPSFEKIISDKNIEE